MFDTWMLDVYGLATLRGHFVGHDTRFKQLICHGYILLFKLLIKYMIHVIGDREKKTKL